MFNGDSGGSFSTIVVNRFLGDAPGSISGTVFNDANGNGILDKGETGLAGRELYLDLNNNGVFDSSDYYVKTSASGAFTFANLAPGTYTVREVLPAGAHLTAPAGDFFTVQRRRAERERVITSGTSNRIPSGNP